MGDVLDENTLRSMRRIVVQKMLHGETDAVQLQAAELVARMSGVLDAPPKPAEEAASEACEDSDMADTSEDSGGNGHAVGANDAPLDVNANVEMES